jgi:tRNA-splicing endonuclease subunit Sen2
LGSKCDLIHDSMSLINPTSRSKASIKPSSRRAETARLYAYPIPIILPDPTYTFLGLSLIRPLNPHCTALFDPVTRSAWVLNTGDATILWQRGFFGKGDLSRSEPSWLARQINARKMKGKGASDSLVFLWTSCRTLLPNRTSKKLRDNCKTP